MPDEKKPPQFEALDFGEGFVCDTETGICEIPGAGAPKPGVQPPATDKETNHKGDR